MEDVLNDVVKEPANQPHLQQEQADQGGDPFDEIFGGGEDYARAFGVPVEEEKPDEGNVPRDPVAPQPKQEGPAANDPNYYVRATHWQSEHDKLKNKYEELERKLKDTSPAPEPEPEREVFPDPPSQPERPMNFSLEEAIADPSSESARYQQKVARYQQEMMDYNILKTEWVRQSIEKERDALKAEINSRKEMEAATRAEAERNQKIVGELMRTQGVDQSTAVDFIRTMSNPEVSLNDLWALYRLKNQSPEATDRRAEFQHIKKTQSQVPPLSTMSSHGQDRTKAPEDSIMDELIGEFNRTNPFG